MKAVVWTAYGSPEVLQYKEVEKPRPKAGEVLVKILATTVTLGDCELRSLRLPFYFSLPMRVYLGVRKPRENTIPGTEFAGVIESVGKGVRRFKAGDEVFGTAGLRFGTNAEYICLPEEGPVAVKPENMSFEEAAPVPFGGGDALHFLKKANLKPGQKIVINGAGGSIGTFAVQLAKYFGAEVTAVDSGEKLGMLRSIGADHLFDYRKEDFAGHGRRYDVIFDVVGKSSYSGCINSLTKNGVYLLANPRMSQMFRGVWTTIRSGITVFSAAANSTNSDLLFLKDLIERGVLKTVIDKRYPLHQIEDAHRYVDSGRKQGNVVVVI